MPKIGAQFIFKSPKANFERDQYDTRSKMKAVGKKEVDQGHIAYCIETGLHYVFNPNNEYSNETGYWTEMTTSMVETGDSAPNDTNKIWVDTSGGVDDPYGEIDQLKSKINKLEIIVNQLAKLLTVGIKAGDSTIGGRTMLSNLSTPIIPTSSVTEDDYYNEESEYEKDSLCVYNGVIYYALEDISSPAGPFDINKWTTESPDALEPYSSSLIATVPNLAVKLDTSANFKKNYVNLIDGELIFCTDISALYIYRNGKFITIGSSKTDDSSKSNTTITIDENNIMTILDESQDNIRIYNGKLYIDNIGIINDNEILEITTI